MASHSHLKSAVSALLVVIQIVYGWNMVGLSYEWNKTFDSLSCESRLVRWNNTFIRLANTRFEEATQSNETRKGVWEGIKGVYVGTKSFSLHIDTVDPRHKHQVHCKVVTYTREEKILSAASLGNGKVVVQLYDKFVIVNLTSCTMVSFTSDGSSIIPDYDTFQITSYADDCKDMCVFKYNDRGQRIQEIKGLEEFRNISKVEISNNNNLLAYYAVHRQNLTFLDSSFNILEEYHFNHPIDSYSLTHGKATLCYLLNNKEFECALRNFKVDLLQSIPNESDIGVHNLVGGGSVVFHRYHFSLGDSVILYRRFNADALADGKKDGSVFMKNKGTDEFKVYSFEEDAAQGIYCAMMLDDTDLIGKCIKVE